MTYRLREVHLPILPKGSLTLRVLHFSDLHLTPNRKREISIIRSWVDLKPDLVISTGDFLGHRDAIQPALHALDPLLDIPGLYVFGSNDYYGPRLKNPLSYLKKDDGTRKLGSRLNTTEFDNRLQSRGWKNLNSSKIEISIKGFKIEARGTDDAHLRLDNYSLVAGKRNPKVDLSIGITHAPYKRVLDAMTSDGLDLVFAGHTHGGQVRVPWFGGTRSLTTNCDLPNWRSRGLTRLQNDPYLHVSAGMGYNQFTPIRFLCPSEATLLTLVT
ncbi:MAG: metallophosphoesterase [Actinobacteria bacterium]|jgi:predicted MPP superfamily phosphohydrolase|nr:metallophosphoesterase [Actinomycetota bacterium]